MQKLKKEIVLIGGLATDAIVDRIIAEREANLAETKQKKKEFVQRQNAAKKKRPWNSNAAENAFVKVSH